MKEAIAMPVSGETILVKREVEEGGNTQAVFTVWLMKTKIFAFMW